MIFSHSFLLHLGLAATSSYVASAASSPKKETPLEPCTVRSPTTHAFFDLNPLHVLPPGQDKSKHARTHSWNATGYELGYNFTMNFCGPVIEELDHVVGVDKDLWKNISAYYKQDGKTYSLGLQNSAPLFRGRKLVLNYTDGSPCDADAGKRSHTVNDIMNRELVGKPKGDQNDDDDDDEDDDSRKKPSKKPSSSVRRKNTIISMLCDRDPLSPLLTLSFVGSPDECTYVFEGRSSAVCGGVEAAKQTLSPSGVFGVIAFIALLVYLVGGCVYSRMVLNQRGWRQLPNYALWAGMFGFFKDIFIILTSSCTRCFPSRRGYSRVNGYGGSGSRGRGRGDSDAENRLIDELNEEWED
ncbi:Hypothetical protein R9X50_00419900 [Acrodontium crateriforme]|uniref:MRH domain-containing protein n=1 Tax=Acrodontium crateriforme TaxID=150365 RepID=A0AAQ3M5M5_9PEZI|nr:Hypothetical protein R9X50_00419900 [Acrodontium crateriforme]